MVFFSTLQALFGTSPPRSIFAFGVRRLTVRMLLEEIIVGVILVMPLAALVAFLTTRLTAKRPFKRIRADVWTTVVITLVGDLFLEVLQPSVKCIPLEFEFQQQQQHGDVDDFIDAFDLFAWLLQLWGISCPTDTNTAATATKSTIAHSERWLTPEAAGSLLTIRLLILCVGVYFGESFVPIALTGGIACGKSTVAQLLISYANHNNNNSKDDDDLEGSIMLVDTDKIAHEILLSPETIRADPKQYTIPPSQSVYHEILQAFDGYDILLRDDDDEDDNDDDDDQKKNRLSGRNNNTNNNTDNIKHNTNINNNNNNNNIDRRKLGAIIFQDADKRRLLNRITHPRIILIMLQQTISGIFFSNHIVCVDVPLLFESGSSSILPLRWMYAVTIVVACDADLQYQRLRQRNPDLTETQCRDRIQSQWSLEKKVAMADIVIWNNGNLQDLELAVRNARREIFQRLYGIGMSLLQMLLLVGGSLCLAVSWNVFTNI